MPPRADQHASGRRVFDRVGHEVLQQAAQQPPVRAHRQRGRDEGEPEALLAGARPELPLQLPEQLFDTETRPLRLKGAGVEPRDVEERRQNFLDRIERGVDVLGQHRVPGVPVPLHQRCGVEPGGVQGLQDVVARRREEARFREVRVVRIGLGGRQSRIEAREFLRAFADPLLQSLVGALAFLLGRDRVGHVRVGGDEPPVGQRVGSDLDDFAGGVDFQANRLEIVDEAVQPRGDHLVQRARPV
jgi:hypothetical protein